MSRQGGAGRGRGGDGDGDMEHWWGGGVGYGGRVRRGSDGDNTGEGIKWR